MTACLLFCFSSSLFAKKKENPNEGRYREEAPVFQENSPLRSLYNSLDPLSILQHLSFYELYPETTEGKKALEHVGKLLKDCSEVTFGNHPIALPKLDIQAIVSLVTRQPYEAPIKLNEEQLSAIEKIAHSLGNRKLKGFSIKTKEELLALPSEEIDLARGLLLNQFENSETSLQEIRQYEASLDLMALQILVRLPKKASPEDKIREINRFIFQEMQFRFPPHSIYAKDIDLYTFLPSVLDSRQGVCLGVSILYLSLAQRLDLPLEIITPPGHIFVRYTSKDQVLNIETTARGINPPSEMYLGINTRKLEKRTLKEVIGMAFVNQASVAWGKEDYATTVSLYEKASPYLPGDPLLNMFLGFNYLFIGKKNEGKKLLEPLAHHIFDHEVSSDSIIDDYLNKDATAEGIKTVFLHVDETRDSIIEKQKKLQKVVADNPKFRAGLMQLAITWLQLGRKSEALEALLQYHKIDPKNAVVEYYLSMICIERFDYPKAWEFLKNAEALTQARQHNAKALRSIREALKRICPEPI